MPSHRPPENALEALLNILYLCTLDAEDPQRVREYLMQAEKQVDDLIEIHGFNVTAVPE